MMLTSYIACCNFNVILVSSFELNPVVGDNEQHKPAVIERYNRDRCGVDIFNEILKHFSTQPVICINSKLIYNMNSN